MDTCVCLTHREVWHLIWHLTTLLCIQIVMIRPTLDHTWITSYVVALTWFLAHTVIKCWLLEMICKLESIFFCSPLDIVCVYPLLITSYSLQNRSWQPEGMRVHVQTRSRNNIHCYWAKSRNCGYGIHATSQLRFIRTRAVRRSYCLTRVVSPPLCNADIVYPRHTNT